MKYTWNLHPNKGMLLNSQIIAIVEILGRAEDVRLLVDERNSVTKDILQFSQVTNMQATSDDAKPLQVKADVPKLSRLKPPTIVLCNEPLEPDPPRQQWDHKLEFLLATIGLAVGLGNVWRFPYLCQRNGGGAFLIPYFIFMFIEGLPLFFLELGVGQILRRSAVGAWSKVHPMLCGVGISCICVSILLCVYYIVVIAWCLFYFFMSWEALNEPDRRLPWTQQNCPKYPAWNELTMEEHALVNNKSSYSNVTFNFLLEQIKSRKDNFSDCCVRDAPQWYFYEKALRISQDINNLGFTDVNIRLLGCLVFAWLVCFFCVIKGIKTSGKVVYFTATFPYVVLIALLVRGLTLEGSVDGIKTFFTPDWERLKDPLIWLDAATQMFFTLSLGFGAVIAFASYMPVDNNLMVDGYIIVFVNCGTSILAGVVVFSILGYREYVTGIPASELGSGPGLAFMTFSEALHLMDGSQVWSILFFFMLILLGIDSEFGTLEAAIAPLIEAGNKNSKSHKFIITASMCFVMCIVGIPLITGPGYYIFQIFDDYSVGVSLLVIALFQSIGIGWVYGGERFCQDIETLTGCRPWIVWRICWQYVSPLALMIVLVAVIFQHAKSPPSYLAYVGCTQDPVSGMYPGSETWTQRIDYPAWGYFLCIFVVLMSIIPIFIAPIFYQIFSGKNISTNDRNVSHLDWIHSMVDISQPKITNVPVQMLKTPVH